MLQLDTRKILQLAQDLIKNTPGRTGKEIFEIIAREYYAEFELTKTKPFMAIQKLGKMMGIGEQIVIHICRTMKLRAEAQARIDIGHSLNKSGRHFRWVIQTPEGNKIKKTV